MKTLAAILLTSLALALSACGGSEGTLPVINPTTEQQSVAQAAREQVPLLVSPRAPDSWGEDESEARVASQRNGPWLGFTPKSYNWDARQVPTLIGLWTLRHPTGADGRHGAVFAVLTMRPHDFEAETDSGVAEWGSSLESAQAALRQEAGLTGDDIAQSEAITIAGRDAWLLSGYGAGDGDDRGFNFAYVVMSDGAFFYTFRLAGEPDYFEDYQNEFVEFVDSTEFEG